MLGAQEDYHGMVELDSYSSADWSDSGANCDKAQVVRSNSPEAKAFGRLAVSFIIDTVRINR